MVRSATGALQLALAFCHQPQPPNALKFPGSGTTSWIQDTQALPRATRRRHTTTRAPTQTPTARRHSRRTSTTRTTPRGLRMRRRVTSVDRPTRPIIPPARLPPRPVLIRGPRALLPCPVPGRLAAPCRRRRALRLRWAHSSSRNRNSRRITSSKAMASWATAHRLRARPPWLSGHRPPFPPAENSRR